MDRERAGQGNPESNKRIDITEVYAQTNTEEFKQSLVSCNTYDYLYLALHASEINTESINYLMEEFPNAVVEIAGDKHDRERISPLLNQNVKWVTS